ncbi:probable RNA-directed DNA polymerase from transposon BS [Trichonephila clavipes]|nr:probable RNA-directed DNA polymerase from transposon BS [Trichonephila clavipes]
MAPMIIFGDFKLHHPMRGSDHISRYSNEFVEWITDSNLVLLNTAVPTYRNSAGAASLIDLTVCSSSMSGYCNSYVLDCSFESDHSPIITELSLLSSNKRIFKKVNWQAVMNQTHFILNNPEANSENLSDKISQVILLLILGKLKSRIDPSHHGGILNNRFITHPQLQADMFADYFASKNAYHEPLPLDFLYDKNNLLNKPFHILELHSAIKSSKNTTPGADDVTAIFIKNLDQGQRDVILRYFPKLFDNAIVPDSWKHAIILPVPKPCKDKTKISSYRPIALTSVFSKTFERILANRISYYLTKERKLHSQHYGFVPFKDSRSATYLVHKAIMNAKLQKKFFVRISLDIKSAYDSVYVDGLIYKCLQIGIAGNIANWIHKFLTSRSFQIKWRGYFSPKKLVPQGLAQGSVLSPILYTIYMHDIFETLESKVECLVYADDIFVFYSHKSLDVICKNIQNTLERIFQWCKYWKLNLSPDKCTIAELSNKRNYTLPNILLAGFPLQWQTSIKYLGDTLAFCQALDDLVESNVNLLVLSDSLSVLSAVQNFSIKSYKVIHRLANKIYMLSNYVNQLILLWTPGHSKIVWNEQADNLARSVAESNVYIDWIVSGDIHKNIY